LPQVRRDLRLPEVWRVGVGTDAGVTTGGVVVVVATTAAAADDRERPYTCPRGDHLAP
jgi:hypothetical protein